MKLNNVSWGIFVYFLLSDTNVCKVVTYILLFW